MTEVSQSLYDTSSESKSEAFLLNLPSATYYSLNAHRAPGENHREGEPRQPQRHSLNERRGSYSWQGEASNNSQLMGIHTGCSRGLSWIPIFARYRFGESLDVQRANSCKISSCITLKACSIHMMPPNKTSKREIADVAKIIEWLPKIMIIAKSEQILWKSITRC